MCINYQTSLGALMIGEVTGLILILDQDQINTNYDKIFIGLFVMFYSLIQFFELMIYINPVTKNQIYKKMLVLNLGFQGLLFFLIASYIYKINSIYLVMCGLVSFIIMLNVFENNIDINFTNTQCLKWDFLSSSNINVSLGIMYFAMFLWIFTESNSYYIKYIGVILLSTFLFSYFLQYDKTNSPGIWCLSSAIAAPLFLLK